MKRLVLFGFFLLLSLFGAQSYTNPDPTTVSSNRLLEMACGGVITDSGVAPDLIPELRAAAANALAEIVMDARGQSVPLALDLGPTWEWAAGQGSNPECRALGAILLPQIYLDSARLDNPFADAELGLSLLIDRVTNPPAGFALELTLARAEALVIACRAGLFGGTPSDVVTRLESISNGGSEAVYCGTGYAEFDGTNPAVQQVLSDSLKGAYMAQIGPIALAPEIHEPEERARVVCSELSAKLLDDSSSEPYRLAAGKAFIQGNEDSRLPELFSYNCIDEKDLLLLTENGGILADAAIYHLAKQLARGDTGNHELEELLNESDSPHSQLAVALALGSRWADQASVDPNTGNVMLADIDLIEETARLTGSPRAVAYSLPIAQTWAGQAMDTSGHCILPNGKSDCFTTLSKKRTSDSWMVLNSQQELGDLNPKIYYDQEIHDHVLISSGSAEGLDILPLSAAKSGGTASIAVIHDPTTGMPVGARDLEPFLWFNGYIHEPLITEGLLGGYEGHLAESFEISLDSHHVLFRTRKGVKWSDGTPFTTPDILFNTQIAFECMERIDQESGEVDLVPFFSDLFLSTASTNRECSGFPATLSETAFIDPGPDGILDSVPIGDDFLFGNRILPSAPPLIVGKAGNNVMHGENLETVPFGDDELIRVGQNEIVLIWQSYVRDGFKVGLSWRFCCWPQHILAGSYDEAITENNPKILLDRWNLEEIQNQPENIIGTGAFVLQEYIPGVGGGVIYRRNPYYWSFDEAGNRLPKLDAIHIIRYPDTNTKLQAFLEGQLDVYNPSIEDKIPLQEAKAERGIALYSSNQASTERYWFMALNGDLGELDEAKEALAIAFRNPEVRRAISQGINRRFITDQLYQGNHGPSFTGNRPSIRDIASPVCPPGRVYEELEEFCIAFQSVKGNISFDLSAAKSKLDSIGIRDLNQDGVRDISVGFGFIVPGENGKLDSVPSGDDFLQAGLLHSGIGLTDRDDDGNVDSDPGIIQPGPNGVLDSMVAGDDVSEITSQPGSLSFTYISPVSGLDNPFIMSFEEAFNEIGVDLTYHYASLPERVARILSDPPNYEAISLVIAGADLFIRLRDTFGSCAPLHAFKRSDCRDLDAREPYQVRIDELDELVTNARDELTEMKLHAEMQLLQTANMPWIFLWSPRRDGTVLQNRINAAAIPQEGALLFYAELLFRLDRQ